jgi:hypothetical protein
VSRAITTSVSSTRTSTVTETTLSAQAQDIGPFLVDLCTAFAAPPDSGYISWGMTRTEICAVSPLFVTTSLETNGVVEPTGTINLDVFEYYYTSTNLPTVAYQIGVAAYEGWGAALDIGAQEPGAPIQPLP